MKEHAARLLFLEPVASIIDVPEFYRSATRKAADYFKSCRQAGYQSRNTTFGPKLTQGLLQETCLKQELYQQGGYEK